MRTLSDHPRIRGEHWPIVFQTLESSGSSPHTRGAQVLPLKIVDQVRIIPAYAGSTRERDHGDFVEGDHPRIRGEHPPSTRSSPTSIRIIPAYAGSTWTFHASKALAWDHPRIRGEHFPDRCLQGGSRGSSPHTRGALSDPGYDLDDPGIIPAYAGSTRS